MSGVAELVKIDAFLFVGAHDFFVAEGAEVGVWSIAAFLISTIRALILA